MLCTIGASLMSLYGQDNAKDFIYEIEHNNKDLLSLQLTLRSDSLKNKAERNLPDPEISYYYLPLGNHSNGDYNEVQISQSVKFPTYYSHASRLNKEQHKCSRMQYRVMRQEVLLNAVHTYNSSVYYSLRIQSQLEQTNRLERIYNNIKQLHEGGEVSVLVANKAKVAWLKSTYDLEDLQSRLNMTVQELKMLNGGQSMVIEPTQYFGGLDSVSFDSLWQIVNKFNASFNALRQKVNVQEKYIGVQKSQSMPNLTAGYNRQGISGDIYSGVYAGVSIPLWSNRYKVKAAKMELQASEANLDAQVTETKLELRAMYDKYILLFKRYQNYKTELQTLQPEPMLLQAYQLGEISYYEYFIEQQFYSNAHNELLSLELELYQLYNQLVKHQL